MSDAHHRHLEAVFAKARINQSHYPSAQLEVRDETATVTLTLQPDYHHGMEAVHGAVYFKMLDDAAYFAAQSVVSDCFLVTTGFHIHLMRPVVSGRITAHGSLRFRSRQLWIAEAALRDKRGREIACGTGHFAKTQIALHNHKPMDHAS